jgi:hypothetical protein
LVCLFTDIEPDTPAVLGERPLQFTGIDLGLKIQTAGGAGPAQELISVGANGYC